MPTAARIVVEESDPSVNEVVLEGLRAFNRRMADWPARQHFNVVLRDPENDVRGGMLASLSCDVMRIEDIFIEETYRAGGFGAQLMRAAESEGIRRGARLALVNTFSWQARPFYEKLGYRVFAEIPYRNGAVTLFWLQKSLCA
jgi:GNAT superfamily N-acetyltransferase